MEQRKADLKTKRSLLVKGLLVFLIGLFSVMIFMVVGIGGLLREIARLTVIIGFVLIVVGLFMKIFRKR